MANGSSEQIQFADTQPHADNTAEAAPTLDFMQLQDIEWHEQGDAMITDFKTAFDQRQTEMRQMHEQQLAQFNHQLAQMRKAAADQRGHFEKLQQTYHAHLARLQDSAWEKDLKIARLTKRYTRFKQQARNLSAILKQRETDFAEQCDELRSQNEIYGSRVAELIEENVNLQLEGMIHREKDELNQTKHADLASRLAERDAQIAQTLARLHAEQITARAERDQAHEAQATLNRTVYDLKASVAETTIQGHSYKMQIEVQTTQIESLEAKLVIARQTQDRLQSELAIRKQFEKVEESAQKLFAFKIGRPQK